MAISLVGINTKDNLANNNKPFNALPPAGIIAGDMLISAVSIATSTAGDITPTPPAGWTLLFSILDDDLSTQPEGLWVYYRWATSSEPASWSWTVVGTVQRMIVSVLAYRGVDPTNPFNAGEYAGAKLGASSTTRTTPTITVGGSSDRWLIALYGGKQAETYIGTMTERVDYATSNTSLMIEDSNGPVAPGSYARSATASVAQVIGAQAIFTLKQAPSTNPPTITGASTDGGMETVILNATPGSAPITSYTIVSGDPGGSLQPGGPTSNVFLVPRNATADFNITVKATNTAGDSNIFNVLIPKLAANNPNENIRMRKYDGVGLV